MARTMVAFYLAGGTGRHALRNWSCPPRWGMWDAANLLDLKNANIFEGDDKADGTGKVANTRDIDSVPGLLRGG